MVCKWRKDRLTRDEEKRLKSFYFPLFLRDLLDCGTTWRGMGWMCVCECMWKNLNWLLCTLQSETNTKSKPGEISCRTIFSKKYASLKHILAASNGNKAKNIPTNIFSVKECLIPITNHFAFSNISEWFSGQTRIESYCFFLLEQTKFLRNFSKWFNYFLSDEICYWFKNSWKSTPTWLKTTELSHIEKASRPISCVGFVQKNRFWPFLSTRSEE